ncbi:MAG TPA: hypothetical protein VLA76_13015 [Candidatus Angelobacter sp.]|nr:hypothetical protein [Candidatus Angelobacter sp.]
MAMIVASLAGSVALSVATNVALLVYGGAVPAEILISIATFNVACISMSAVGGLIEWRRSGHAIGRLLLLGGPLYAFLAAGWTTGDALAGHVDERAWAVVNWLGAILSYPGVLLIAGWIPLLFPTGSLPGPRWRLPAAVLLVLLVAGLAAWAVRPGPVVDVVDLESPIAIDGWPPFLQVLVDAIPLVLLGTVALAAVALVVRYRRAGPVERLQVRWLGAAIAVCVLGFIGIEVEALLRTDDGLLVSTVVVYAGILGIPLSIGIAVLRYRLYGIDLIIRRTLVYGTLSLVLGASYVGLVLTLQAIVRPFIADSAPVVALSTLAVAGMFGPARRRIQVAIDRRFYRSRYDARHTVEALASQLRDQVVPDHISALLVAVAASALQPASASVWLRRSRVDPT